MSFPDSTVYLLDVDNTLLNNDAFEADRHQQLSSRLGEKWAERYWATFELLLGEVGYTNYLAPCRASASSILTRGACSKPRITVAYPFSARPRGHRVLLDGKHSVEAMCAIDALGIAPMPADREQLPRSAERSRDRGATRSGRGAPLGIGGDGRPVGKHVHGRAERRRVLRRAELLRSKENAERYLREHDHVHGSRSRFRKRASSLAPSSATS